MALLAIGCFSDPEHINVFLIREIIAPVIVLEIHAFNFVLVDQFVKVNEGQRIFGQVVSLLLGRLFAMAPISVTTPIGRIVMFDVLFSHYALNFLLLLP